MSAARALGLRQSAGRRRRPTISLRATRSESSLEMIPTITPGPSWPELEDAISTAGHGLLSRLRACASQRGSRGSHRSFEEVVSTWRRSSLSTWRELGDSRRRRVGRAPDVLAGDVGARLRALRGPGGARGAHNDGRRAKVGERGRTGALPRRARLHSHQQDDSSHQGDLALPPAARGCGGVPAALHSWRGAARDRGGRAAPAEHARACPPRVALLAAQGEGGPPAPTSLRTARTCAPATWHCRAQVGALIKHPERIADARLRSEVCAAVAADPYYGPDVEITRRLVG